MYGRHLIDRIDAEAKKNIWPIQPGVHSLGSGRKLRIFCAGYLACTSVGDTLSSVTDTRWNPHSELAPVLRMEFHREALFTHPGSGA
jgi:hypothetical protein